LKKLFKSKLFTWISLFLFSPLGIFLLWKNKFYKTKTNAILTAIFGIFFIIAMASEDPEQSNNAKSPTEQIASETQTKEKDQKENKNKESIENKESNHQDQTQTKESKEQPSNTQQNTDKTSQPTNQSSNQQSNIVSSIPNTIPAYVYQTVDGDTVKVKINNREETIRMILVDTPETKHPSKPEQPFGKEASEFTRNTLLNKHVDIELGIQERDKYGRLLAYIYIDGKMFNKMLVEKGLARVAVFPPNTKYLDEFKALESKAKQQAIGIWSIENYVEEDGFNTPNQSKSTASTTQPKSNHSSSSSSSKPFVNNPSDDKESNVSCKGKIKGNANSKIYHVPGGAYYEKTQDNIVWFCTEEEAQAAGYRKSKR
jgi:micrococcal nuclease